MEAREHNDKVESLYLRIEEIGALALFAGLLAMMFDAPSFTTQIGIALWLTAQFGWLYWRAYPKVPHPATMFMGVLNFAGSCSFFYGSIMSDNMLGCFISVAYLCSASQQFLSGLVRCSFMHKHPKAAMTQAMGFLIAAAFFQSLAAMGFIVMSAIPGVFFVIAAGSSLMGHILKYQLSLMLANTPETQVEEGFALRLVKSE